MKPLARIYWRIVKPKWLVVMATSVALFASSCGPSTQNLMTGKGEAESALKVTAEFSRDGRAKLTMLGHVPWHIPAERRK
jgi:hypothetical protein